MKILKWFANNFSFYPTMDIHKISTPKELEEKAWRGVGNSIMHAIKEYEKKT